MSIAGSSSGEAWKIARSSSSRGMRVVRGEDGLAVALCGFPARRCLRPHAGPAPRRRYERRRPEKTPLHKVISENLASWLAWRDAAERPVPAYVEDELRGYLEYGILCFGFGRALCTGCGQGFVIAARLSRARQPWEPLAFPSAAWQDGAMDGPPCLWLAPPVPVRQWVISVPKRLRCFLAARPETVSALTKIFLAEIERLLCAAAGAIPAANTTASRPRLGAISFLHRFGSDVPSYVRSLEHLLRYCARPPFALERLSVTRDASGRAAEVRYLLPRHKAATWVGPGRSRKSTPPEPSGVVELSPFEFLDRLADLVPPPRRHRHRPAGGWHGGRAKPRLWLRPPKAAGAMNGTAAVKQARGVCAESPAQAGRHVARDRQHRQAAGGRGERARA